MNEYRVILENIDGDRFFPVCVWADDKREARQKAYDHFKSWGFNPTKKGQVMHLGCEVVL